MARIKFAVCVLKKRMVKRHIYPLFTAAAK